MSKPLSTDLRRRYLRQWAVIYQVNAAPKLCPLAVEVIEGRARIFILRIVVVTMEMQKKVLYLGIFVAMQLVGFSYGQGQFKKKCYA